MTHRDLTEVLIVPSYCKAVIEVSSWDLNVPLNEYFIKSRFLPSFPDHDPTLPVTIEGGTNFGISDRITVKYNIKDNQLYKGRYRGIKAIAGEHYQLGNSVYTIGKVIHTTNGVIYISAEPSVPVERKYLLETTSSSANLSERD